MAHLILNGIGPIEDPDNEKHYEFDPGDGRILNEIRELLSMRKSGDKEMIEKMLSSLCKASLEKKKTMNARKTGISVILKSIKRNFPILSNRYNKGHKDGAEKLSPYPC